MKFWNSQLTEKSWGILQELRKKYDFILIGGWATYLWTKQQKSKDIDIAVDIEEMQILKKANLSKNDNLKKYEMKFGEIDVDIYVSYFSKLTIPVEDLKKYSAKTEGFNVAIPEALLVLKQGAEIDRRNSVKGEKDKIDIISLLFFSNIDLKKYKSIIEKYSLETYINDLISLLTSFKDYNSLNLTPREFKIKKQNILALIKKV
ncbi:hypothetical protein J4463_02385 [Candidatus Pacearchaeota archaeon]|nr:hypothetical protein [Candidatus Pacearchaeota archaeon]